MEASAVPRAAPTGVSGLASPQLLRLASDSRLVALVRQGWPAAFETIYNRHHRGILSFCRHMLSDPDEAEDAVQHTFLAAYNDLIASEKPIHLRAWLFTIARNRCYSILRSRREQPAAELEEQPTTEGLAAQVQRRQDLRDLVVDMRRLPDEQRAALVLAEIDALSHEEIGEALGVPREKVKALVFQARESLLASRTARETACTDIREQLATGRGGSLRRANLRRHLRECAGCRDFRKSVERQRRQIAILIPVIPSVALRDVILGGTIGAGATAGLAGGGLVASSALKSGLFKGLATLLLAGAGTAGTFVATNGVRTRDGDHSATTVGHRNHHVTTRVLTAAQAHSSHIAAVPSGYGRSGIISAAGWGARKHANGSWSSGRAPLHIKLPSAAPKLVAAPSAGDTGPAASRPAPISPTPGGPYLGTSAWGSGSESSHGLARGTGSGASQGSGGSSNSGGYSSYERSGSNGQGGSTSGGGSGGSSSGDSGGSTTAGGGGSGSTGSSDTSSNGGSDTGGRGPAGGSSSAGTSSGSSGTDSSAPGNSGSTPAATNGNPGGNGNSGGNGNAGGDQGGGGQANGGGRGG
jgi:RNA polymerase sigma factor (sigma-70 family)